MNEVNQLTISSQKTANTGKPTAGDDLQGEVKDSIVKAKIGESLGKLAT